MTKRKIAVVMAGTILSGSLFATDPTSPVFDNSTIVPYYFVSFPKDLGFLSKGEAELSRRMDANHKELTKRADAFQHDVNQRFDSMQRGIDANQKETNQRSDRLEGKIDSLISMFNMTQQRNEQRFVEGYTNLTKAEQALSLNVATTQATNTVRFEKLEAHWSQNFYEDVVQNAQSYFGLLLLGAGVRASSIVPAHALPYASGACYAGSWVSFMQVSYNLLASTLSVPSMINVMGSVGITLAGVIFAVHQNEPHLAPQVTGARFIVLVGIMAGVSSYWKEAYGLVQAWFK